MTDTLPSPTIPTPPTSAKPWWKKKKFFIPVGVIGALVAIAAVSPSEEQPEAVAPTTDAEIAAQVATDGPIAVEAPTATIAPDPVVEEPVATVAAPDPVVDEPAATLAPLEAPATESLMPDVVGMNLQDAQNLIQEQGVFLSLSEDATGQGRMQVLDSNWVVVSQNIQPGQPFGEGDAVLSVVKYTD